MVISMKKEKFLENIVGSFLIVLFGYFLLSLNEWCSIPFLYLVPLFYFLYSVVHFGMFFFHRKDQEYSDLFLGFVSLILGGIALFTKILETPKYFAFLILIWTLIWCLIKLKKADYYHDRKSKMWLIFVTSLLLFFFTSIFVSIHLDYSEDVRILIWGFYVLIEGIFELYEAMILNLTRGKLK